jgi:cbb3-type cytochrome oxidase subunit 3
MNMLFDYAPIIGLLFFFFVFLWIAFRTYRPKAKSQMQNHALIPLKEDKDHE